MNISSPSSHRRIRPVWHASLFGALLGSTAALAQTAPVTPPPTYDPSFVQQILKRLDAQDAEIKRLNQQLQKQGTEIEAVSTTDTYKKDTFPRVTFHGFGNIDYQIKDFKTKKNAFALGELDLFIDSRLSETLHLVNEDVLAASADNNFSFEIERLFLQWEPNEYFHLAMGRYHTSIGYYNTAYHHGTWFQTATGRPSFLEFEDRGGLITAHSVGLSASGEIPSGRLGLSYFVEVGNGRPFRDPASGKGPVLNVGDNNLYKAVNVGLKLKPEWLPGWELGAGIYHDTLTPDKVPRTDEILAHTFAVYNNANWQFLSEAEFWRHKTSGDKVHLSQAAFAQLSQRMGVFTPYARFTYQNASVNDPVWNLVQAAGLKYGPSVGVRWDFSQLAAFKVQYDYFLQPKQSDLQQLTFQVAFTF